MGSLLIMEAISKTSLGTGIFSLNILKPTLLESMISPSSLTRPSLMSVADDARPDSAILNASSTGARGFSELSTAASWFLAGFSPDKMSSVPAAPSPRGPVTATRSPVLAPDLRRTLSFLTLPAAIPESMISSDSLVSPPMRGAL